MAEGHDTFHHVRDADMFELPFGVHLELPAIELPVLGEFQITKFMVLQVVAAVFCFVVFRGLARRVRDGQPARGRWWNFWEALALFIRDEVVRPTIGEGHDHHDAHDGHGHSAAEHGAGGGHRAEVDVPPSVVVSGDGALSTTGSHPADEHLPFIWSCFFYVLICNLLGAIPWMGSATGNLNVTGVLALCVLLAVILTGTRASGAGGFWKSLAPSMDLPPALKVLIVPMIWVIEVVGLLIKHGVLGVRLFANIMAGHTVIAVVLGFIGMVAGSSLWYGVMPASILGQVGIGLLELFVAFLQAYVFAFLATLFVATAVHPH